AQEARSPLAQWRRLPRIERRRREKPRQRGRARLCERHRSRHRHGLIRYDVAHILRSCRHHRCCGRSRSHVQRRRQGPGGSFVTVTRSVIVGCGSYLPSRVLSNNDLARMVDTSDSWIVERTGIKQRHIASEGETTSDLALESAKRALKHADIAASDLDLVIVATTTPDETFPSTATRIQARLGMTRGAAFDVQAVCTGFIYGLSVADSFIRSGQAKTVLVIGAETMSRILDWKDRGTCVLFGDGAGAAVLTAAEDAGTNKDRGILNTRIFSDGRLHDLLYTDGGVSSTRSAGHLRMQGK